MSMEKMSKFEEILKRENSSIKDERAKRISKSVANAQKALVMELEQQVMDLEDKLEAMTDLSTDNQSTTLNRIEDFNASNFVKAYHKIKMEIALAKIQLDKAQESLTQIFS